MEQEEKEYQSSRILYKTDNSEGWHLAAMDSAPDEAKKYCEEQKKSGAWHDYQCHLAGTSHLPPENPHKIYPEYPLETSAYMMNLVTSLIYNRHDGKWYWPEEIMPMPKIKARLCKNFALDIKPDDDDLNYKEDFESAYADIRILPYENKYRINIPIDSIDVSGFIKGLKKHGYSNLAMEFRECKFLAWKTGENILLIFQNYYGEEVEELIRILVPEQIFYSEFIKLDESLKYISARNLYAS